jgi:signal transduction histidine kinase/ActR/RegA family two-component response regulator
MRELSSRALQEGRPVELRGVVVLFDDTLRLLVVEDATGGVPVALPARTADVQEGDRVLVEGFSSYEGFTPLVVKATLKRLGAGQARGIDMATAQEVLEGRWDYRRILIECKVRDLVGSQTGHATVSAEIDGQAVSIMTSGRQTSEVHLLFGRRARVRGVPVTTYAPSGLPYSVRIYTGRTGRVEPAPEASAASETAAPSKPDNVTALPTLSRIMQVKALPAEQAERGYPVRLRGVVTNRDPEDVNLYLQDVTAAVYVIPEAPLPPTLKRRDLVEVQGITGQGGFAPIVYSRSIRILGEGPLPQPRRVDPAATVSSQDENAWVELDGLVLAATPSPRDTTALRLRHGPTTIVAVLQAPLDSRERRSLVSTHVRLRGTLSPQFASGGHLIGVKLFVPSQDEVQVLGVQAGDTFESPARPIQAVLGYSPEIERPARVKIRGQVVYAGFVGEVHVMDQTGGMRLRDVPAGLVSVGEEIEALGFLGPIGPHANLGWVEVRRSSSQESRPRPRSVAAADLRSGLFDGELVSVDAFLRSRRLSYGDRIFELDAGPIAFTAVLERPQTFSAWQSLRDGALLRLTGVSHVEWNTDDSPPTPVALRLLLRSPDDIVLLRRAPWWTLGRAMVIVASLLGGLLLAVAWVGTLQRRVRAQTALLEHQMQQREALEATLRQAQRLESLGQLAGGVAHDFNNILVAINSYSHLLLRELKGQEKALGWVEQIRKAGERAAMLTRQLLALSRRQILRPVIVNLNELIRDVDEMLRRILGEDVELVSHLAAEPLAVRVDPGQVSQVVMNLCVNARDAMPEGGRLTLETSAVDLDAAYARSHPGVAPGEYVCLTVTDTGLGMDDKTRARIFEPFFTTKRAGTGTGLGLSIALGIVEQSGGRMWVYSEPGHGTTFKIYFPKATGIPERRSPKTQPSRPMEGHETILVVEDDRAVQRLAIETLMGFGYTVLGVSTGEEAVTLALRHTPPVQLLVTDVVLPGMNGRKLADRLTAEIPGLRVLFMSGYTHDIVAHRGVLDSEVDFLSKPFGPAELGAAVRAALDRK